MHKKPLAGRLERHLLSLPFVLEFMMRHKCKRASMRQEVSEQACDQRLLRQARAAHFIWERKHSAVPTLKMVLLMMSEWMAATPLTALLPTTARYAIFTSLRNRLLVNIAIQRLQVSTFTLLSALWQSCDASYPHPWVPEKMHVL